LGGLGGVGGAGGATTGIGGNGGSGGDGGVGIYFAATGASLTNTAGGDIQAGNGASGGALGASGGGNGTAGLSGVGGTAVVGSGLTITNNGTIAGGFASDGITRGDAIVFTGGVNSLTIQSGSIISGNVVAVSGGTDTFALGGSTNSSFTTTQIGAQYQNFTVFNKTGTSIWTLTGTPAQATPWVISNGTLTAGAATNVFGATSAITVDAPGFLDLAGNSQQIGSLTGGGTVTDGSLAGVRLTTGEAANTLFSGVIQNGAGSMALTKQGTGVFTLAGINTYTGATTIDAGAIELGSGGSISGNVTFADGGAGATLRLDSSTSQVGGAIAGLGQSEAIDLAFLGFHALTQTVWQENGGNTGGTLSLVENSVTLASLNLAGQYTSSDFIAASDGHNGTLVEESNLNAIVWATGANGDFAVAANWNPASVPGASDNADIAANGTYKVTSSANETFNSLTTAADATLFVAAGIFTTSNGTDGANAGTVDVGGGGTWELGGAFFNTGLIEALGGAIITNATITGSGLFEIGDGGSVNATGSNYVFDGACGSALIEGTGNLSQAFSETSNAQLYFVGNQNQLFGGSMSDWIGVSGNNNALVGGSGNDFIGATGSTNTLAGGSASPTLFADGNANYLYAGTGATWEGASGNQNQIFGGPGGDWMGASGINNAISAGTGNSTLFADGTGNTLSGGGSGGGNDWIGVSGSGNYLYGGSGNDYLAATGNGNVLNPNGSGTDTLVAAANAHNNDLFVYHPVDAKVAIDNFSAAVDDVIDFAGWGITNVSQLAPYLTHSADGSDVIALSGSQQLTLEGVTGALQNPWFNFHA
jgi:fibronectin-binding autotransporter adhesin